MQTDAPDDSPATEVDCSKSRLDADTVVAMERLWAGARPINAPVYDRLEQVVPHLRRHPRACFRFEGFEETVVLWQSLGPCSAVLQECRAGRLVRVHQLSRVSPTRIAWQQQEAGDTGEAEKDFSDLLGVLVLVPCFGEWSQAPGTVLGWASETAGSTGATKEVQ
jgi:hypothetical protein